MIRTHQLLTQKYSLSADGVGPAVESTPAASQTHVVAFAKALAAWQKKPSSAARERLLDASLDVLEALKAIVLNPTPSTGVENIYQKRHIAAGIPSMYGTYTEPKFDALGLSFRVENLVARLLEDLVVEGVDPYVTRDSLRRMAAVIRRFERALSADGVDSRNLAANVRLLESSFSSHNFTFHQYHNVFQFIGGSVAELSRNSVLSHDQVLHTVLEHDPRQCEARGMSVDAVAEMVLREVLVSALGMQTLDRYVLAALRQMSTLTGRLGSAALTRMMNYDPERLISPIHEARPGTDDQMTLGFKGLGLKQMASYDHQVPPGFILTTELFGAMPAMAHRPLFDDTLGRLGSAIARLEKDTGLRLGDPDAPAHAVHQVRSGHLTARSDDHVRQCGPQRPPGRGPRPQAWLRVGGLGLVPALPADVGHGFGGRPGFLRRHHDRVQEPFRHREEERVLPRAHAPAGPRVRSRSRDRGVRFVDDPFRQVVGCVRKVLSSWDSPEAKLYRRYLGLAAEWGTAVVVQRMVFGNLSRESGSGVTFTRNPLEPYSSQVRLFGDFTTRSQGEDLVGGLVFPAPISEAQRLGSPTYQGIDHSLEGDFPDVYRALLEVARDLVANREHEPQEIEFTFESASGDSLYILQKRPMVHEQQDDAPYFDVHFAALRPARGRGHGGLRRRVLRQSRHRHGADRSTPGGGPARRHPALAPGYGARGHRHDRTGVWPPDRSGRGHLSRGRHRQAPGQDGRGRLPGIGGARASGRRPAGGHGVEGGRLALDRRPNR